MRSAKPTEANLSELTSLTELTSYIGKLIRAWFNHEQPDLLDISVTINKSPPSEQVLGKLLSTGAAGIVVGTYTGLTIIPPEASPLMMLACVAGGIIFISTAVGIGRALQDGLYQRILRLISPPPPRNGKR
jgi:hypothetical protein